MQIIIFVFRFLQQARDLVSLEEKTFLLALEDGKSRSVSLINTSAGVGQMGHVAIDSAA